MVKDLLKEAIDEQSKEFAKNDEMINKVLVKMILNYKKSFAIFSELNDEKLKEFFKKSEDKNWLKDNIEFASLLLFLNSGTHLSTANNKLEENKFNNYKIIASEERLNNIYEILSEAENSLQWKKFKKTYNELQFILAFHDNIELRTDYFKRFLWELSKEEEMENKDYKTDIVQRVIPDFPVNINQYNYS